jgi:hypothetical protein
MAVLTISGWILVIAHPLRSLSCSEGVNRQLSRLCRPQVHSSL